MSQASASTLLNVSLPAQPAQIYEYVGATERLLRCGFPPERITPVAPDRFRLRMRPLVWMGLSLEPTAELLIGSDQQGRAWARLEGYELVGHPWLVKHLKLDFQAALLVQPTSESGRTALKGWAEASAAFPPPPFLAWVPEAVLTGGARTILEGFLWILRDRLNRSLEQDFQQWKQEQTQAGSISALSP
ncbi:MAG: DUF1997 domain-containing protein [Gemmatimonadaceae bacterium]|nr:DUF1997 domain-containing protein [Gloeobacterales cyanobacterium ES-bin-141]